MAVTTMRPIGVVDRLGSVKAPQTVEFRESFLPSHTRKILKQLLRRTGFAARARPNSVALAGPGTPDRAAQDLSRKRLLRGRHGHSPRTDAGCGTTA